MYAQLLSLPSFLVRCCQSMLGNTWGTELKIFFLYHVHVVICSTGMWFYGSIKVSSSSVYELHPPFPLLTSSSALTAVVSGHTTAFSWRLFIAEAMIQLYP